MNRGKDYVTVTTNVNINQAVKEAYEWAILNNQNGLNESYEAACLKRSDLKGVSPRDCEQELFIDHSGNGTPEGSWKTFVQREDGRISAILILSEGTLYADILYTDGEFRLLRWHF